MAVNPKLLSRVGSYLRGGPTEREESRTDALAAIESDLAGTDDIGVKEDLSSYLLDDIKFGDVDLSTIRELTPDEKREAVVSKHEDNDNYEAWSPKGDPWSYELIAAEPASASYIVAKKGDRTIKIRPEDTGFAKVLATSPSAIAAGFGKGAPTNTLQPTRDRLEKMHEEYMAKLPPGPTLGPEEAPTNTLQPTRDRLEKMHEEYMALSQAPSAIAAGFGKAPESGAVPDYESMSGAPNRDNYVERDHRRVSFESNWPWK